MIREGEKFAFVSLRTNQVARDMPQNIILDGGYSARRSSPAQLEGHWQEWLGSIANDHIKEAELVLLATAPAEEIFVLNTEDEDLQEGVRHFYSGILLSDSFSTDTSPHVISGQHWGDEGLRVRHSGQLVMPRRVPAIPRSQINEKRIRLAFELGNKVSTLIKRGSHERLLRALNSFIAGCETATAADRLHKFCRAIEGFIVPAIAKTKKHFKSRTEVFIGPSHHSFIDMMYELRSAAEHLHDPHELIEAASERERRETFLTYTLSAEAIARHCALKVLTHDGLTNWFDSDERISRFWELSPSQLKAIWGDELDLASYKKNLNWRTVSDQALGL